MAEGIETADQLAELRALECECGQGYLFGRPLSVAAMSVVLAAARAGHRWGKVGDADSQPPTIG